MTEGLSPERLRALLEKRGHDVTEKEVEDLIRRWVKAFPEMHVFFGYLFRENKKLRGDLRQTRGDLRVVVQELNKVLNDRSIGDEISVRKSAVRPALHALEERRRQRR